MNNYTKKFEKNNNKYKNKFKKLTKKNYKNYQNYKNYKTYQNGQKGGNSSKEKFEVQSLSNFDFDKISLSKYVNANIDWGIMPGPPPKPDCTIL